METAANAYHAMAARMHILPGDGAHTRDVDYMLALNLQAPQTVLATLKNTIRVRCGCPFLNARHAHYGAGPCRRSENSMTSPTVPAGLSRVPAR